MGSCTDSLSGSSIGSSKVSSTGPPKVTSVGSSKGSFSNSCTGGSNPKSNTGSSSAIGAVSFGSEGISFSLTSGTSAFTLLGGIKCDGRVIGIGIPY